MGDPVLEFRDYSFRYIEQAKPTLHHINLIVQAGETVLIAGASGSGKSTLAACINGLNPFSHRGESSGELYLEGEAASKLDIFARSERIGTVLQDPDGQFVGLTVGEDIAFALENDCVPPPALYERTRAAAERTEMADRLHSGPQELSGGQKQRVALSGVIVRPVRILLFDEPLANLDPEAGSRAVELIDRLRRETGAAVMIIEHRLEEVLWRGVNRIILMAEGRIKADLPPDQMLAGTLLAKSGLREPLYLTALRYAGCTVTPEQHPASVEAMRLNQSASLLVRWFQKRRPIPAAPPGEPLLQAEEISFSYSGERSVLKSVSFCLRRGEMVSVAGRNGAGKSTLSRLICGFETPDGGRFLWEGRDLARDTIRERAWHIGYVMQNPNQMISKGTVWEEITLGLTLRGLPGGEIQERAGETLRVCGLYAYRNWPIAALSFGQKKRVTIASVLALRPELLLLDEPTAGQDYRHYTEIMEFLRGLNQRGVTIVMITHDMHLMLEYSTRSLVFAEGELIADASPAEVLSNVQITTRAGLKQTSLFTLARRCGITEATDFVQRFIECDREGRENI